METAYVGWDWENACIHHSWDCGDAAAADCHTWEVEGCMLTWPMFSECFARINISVLTPSSNKQLHRSLAGPCSTHIPEGTIGSWACNPCVTLKHNLTTHKCKSHLVVQFVFSSSSVYTNSSSSVYTNNEICHLTRQANAQSPATYSLKRAMISLTNMPSLLKSHENQCHNIRLP